MWQNVQANRKQLPILSGMPKMTELLLTEHDLRCIIMRDLGIEEFPRIYFNKNPIAKDKIKVIYAESNKEVDIDKEVEIWK